MSQQKSSKAAKLKQPAGSAQRNPRADQYTVLLSISASALLIGIVVLYFTVPTGILPF